VFVRTAVAALKEAGTSTEKRKKRRENFPLTLSGKIT
jgi:hypothetical protein